MIADYLEALLQQAEYTTLPDGSCRGQIPGQDDLWAQAPTREACRQELQAVLEAWALSYSFPDTFCSSRAEGVA
jgi:hypothetical protein